MRGTIPALGLSALLLTACGGDSGAASGSADYLHSFNAIYNDRQLANDKAFQALGSTKLSDASPDQLQTLFTALANNDYTFNEGIGVMSSSGNMDTICQAGSFNWKISFPDRMCADVADLWKAGFSLATDEDAVANIDIKNNAPADTTNADLAKVNSDLDNWKTAANKVRKDLGLPAQS